MQMIWIDILTQYNDLLSYLRCYNDSTKIGDIIMSKRVSKEQRLTIVKRYLNGETAIQLAKELNIARSTIYLWIRREQKSSSKKIQLRDFSRLKIQFERSLRMIHILQTAPCSVSAPLREKLNAIVLMSKDYNVNILCEALKVAKGTYYNHIFRNKKKFSLC